MLVLIARRETTKEWGQGETEKGLGSYFTLHSMTLFSHQDKRKIREEIEKKRRNTEEEKLKLQYLKVCVM